MTAKRDLKRRVRARQAKTGESYVEARRKVQAQQPGAKGSPVPFVELLDLSEAAASAGLRCGVAMLPALAARVDPARTLVRLREALEATDGDPTTATMRAAGLRGEQPAAPLRLVRDYLGESRRFLVRARAGIGGTSAGGRMLALQVGAEMVVCILHLAPVGLGVRRAPSLILTTAEGAIADPLLGLEVLPRP
jgi:hypothetical protein